MKYIKLFENYQDIPSEDDVYKDVDEYFTSLNPNLLDDKGFNAYSSYVTRRNEPNFGASYSIPINKISEKSRDELYNGLKSFLIRKGYDIQTYNPILDDIGKKAAELIARINLSRVNDGTEFGRAIWIECKSGSSIIFYFLPDENPKWWSPGLTIMKTRSSNSVSIYWTEVDKNDYFELVFWNGENIVDGKFKIEFGNIDSDTYEDPAYEKIPCECTSASDRRAYSATAKIPDGEQDPEDVLNINRK